MYVCVNLVTFGLDSILLLMKPWYNRYWFIMSKIRMIIFSRRFGLQKIVFSIFALHVYTKFCGSYTGSLSWRRKIFFQHQWFDKQTKKYKKWNVNTYIMFTILWSNLIFKASLDCSFIQNKHIKWAITFWTRCKHARLFKLESLGHQLWSNWIFLNNPGT